MFFNYKKTSYKIYITNIKPGLFYADIIAKSSYQNIFTYFLSHKDKVKKILYRTNCKL